MIPCPQSFPCSPLLPTLFFTLLSLPFLLLSFSLFLYPPLNIITRFLFLLSFLFPSSCYPFSCFLLSSHQSFPLFPFSPLLPPLFFSPLSLPFLLLLSFSLFPFSSSVPPSIVFFNSFPFLLFLYPSFNHFLYFPFLFPSFCSSILLSLSLSLQLSSTPPLLHSPGPAAGSLWGRWRRT